MAEAILILVQVLTIAIIARIAVSWIVLLFSSMRWLLYHPVVQALDAITEPILAPIRSVMPNFGGLDLSPMIAIIILQVLGRMLAQSV